jgi:hypothetical protein
MSLVIVENMRMKGERGARFLLPPSARGASLKTGGEVDQPQLEWQAGPAQLR